MSKTGPERLRANCCARGDGGETCRCIPYQDHRCVACQAADEWEREKREWQIAVAGGIRLGRVDVDGSKLRPADLGNYFVEILAKAARTGERLTVPAEVREAAERTMQYEEWLSNPDVLQESDDLLTMARFIQQLDGKGGDE